MDKTISLRQVSRLLQHLGIEVVHKKVTSFGKPFWKLKCIANKRQIGIRYSKTSNIDIVSWKHIGLLLEDIFHKSCFTLAGIRQEDNYSFLCYNPYKGCNSLEEMKIQKDLL